VSRLGRALRAELEENWPDEADHPLGAYDQPEVIYGKGSIKESKATKDVIKIEESSDPNSEPLGFRHTHEAVDETATLQLWGVTRRVDGIEVRGGERLFGEAPADGLEGAEIGGLSGDLRDWLHGNRLGVGPYDYVQADWPIDNSDMAGKNEYRADVRVTAAQHARDL